MTMTQDGSTSVRSTSGKWIKVAGIAMLGLGVVLGGCNNKAKEEAELLRAENAEWKERATAAEMKAQQAESSAANANQQVASLQAQVASARTAPAPAPAPASGPEFTQGGAYPPVAGGGGGSNSGNSGRRGRSSDRYVLAGDVSFASGQASLKSEARRELDTIASRLKRDHPGAEIVVEGHTDSDPVRKSKYGSNEALSKARADAVREYLASKGISRNRIDTVGKGASEPKGSKAASRRVEIVVVD